MKRSLAWLLAALPLSLLPRLARPIDVSGQLGGAYLRVDQWARGAHTSEYTWDWNGNLDASGALSPGMLEFSLGARYLSSATYYAGTHSRAEGWGYRLRLAALSSTWYPVTFSASRDHAEFTADVKAGRTGSTVLTNLGMEAEMRRPDLPNVRAQVRRIEIVNRSFGNPEMHADSTVLGLQASQAVQGGNYSVAYDTTWNKGDYADSNYQNHNLAVLSTLELGKELEAQILGHYYLRNPGDRNPLNPRYDSDDLSTQLRWTPRSDVTGNLGYSYYRSTVDIPGADIRDQVGHGLVASANYRAGNWSFNGQTAANVFTTRLGATEERTAGQQLGGSVYYSQGRGRINLTASGGLTLGLFEPAAGRTELAYGASGSLGVSTLVSIWNTTASYAADYGSNVGGLEEKSFRQQLVLQAEGPAWARGNLLARLSLSSQRREQSLLGTAASRTARLEVQAIWRGYLLRLEGGFLDALGDNLSPAGSGDGLFLPLDYNTHSRYAILSASVPTQFGLVLSGAARIASVDVPGRGGSQWERGLELIARYTLGGWTFSVEERLATGGAAGGSSTGNTLLVRASRAFGARF